MIKNITLANAGVYDAAGTQLEDLKKLNFIYGPNGSGKTTISRVIEKPEKYSACSITWEGTSPPGTLVYNRDFVEKHFDAESNIKGIYTFGENKEVGDEIETLKSEADKIEGELGSLQTTLSGEDSESGKRRERQALEEKFREDIWKAKTDMPDLKDAFTGHNNSKENFYTQYRKEALNNTSAVRPVAELCEDMKTVFSGSLSEATELPVQDSSRISMLEKSEILQKKIISTVDVDISALIKTLGNSDWVQQGRQYFDKLEDQCPFCQQQTDADFRRNLEAYFDESYTVALKAIDTLLADYESETENLLKKYENPEIFESPFLENEVFRKNVALIRSALENNIERIKAKKKEPGTSVMLTDTNSLFAGVNAHISRANEKIKENNDIFNNHDARKEELKSQTWKRLLEDTKNNYNQFKVKKRKLDHTIQSLESQIKTAQDNRKATQEKIKEYTRKISSIQPTIEEINKCLKSFGFTSFHLAESSERGFYEVRRAKGDDAKQTLSEGEKSFITFLYFHSLVRGSFNSSDTMNNKIVVFDDPVSSLDADILFIVCHLIKNVIEEMRGGKSPIKQVFVFTHNIYFHKEVTFDINRSGDNAKKDETFWVVRKTPEKSELVSFKKNPVKSSYELLWQEIRHKSPSATTIQNAARRILEHYFKFYGGITPKNIIEKFENNNKVICQSLLSWVNDGSHFARDDLYMPLDTSQVERYLIVFQKIFECSGHGAHYKMMMGKKYTPLPGAVNDDAAH